MKTISKAGVTALRYTGPGLGGAVVNEAAIDSAPGAGTPFDPDTLNMRNQAQTEQVEIHGTATAFTFDLELSAIANNDADNDGLPDDWESLYGLSTSDNGSGDINNGPDGDPDQDGIKNRIEWLVGLNPTFDDRNLYPKLKAERQPDGSVRLNSPPSPTAATASGSPTTCQTGPLSPPTPTPPASPPIRSSSASTPRPRPTRRNASTAWKSAYRNHNGESYEEALRRPNAGHSPALLIERVSSKP